MRYAILNETFDQVTEERFFDVLPPHEIGRVLPIEEDEIPEYNPNTQKVVAGQYVIGEDFVTIGWDIVDLNFDELEQIKLAKAAQTQTDTNAIYNTLPVAYRAAFAPLYVAVKDFLSRGDFEAAYAIIQNQAVPPDLDQVKADLLESIGQNI